MPGFRPLLLVFVLLFARQAVATTAAEVSCQAAAPAGQCVVSAPVTVSAGSILDFGPLALVITSSGSLNAGGGAMFVKAGSVVLQPGSLLASAGGRIDVRVTDGIQVQELSGTRAKIDVTGPTGGSIILAADGAVTINGQLLAAAEVVLGDGGTIDVAGAAVSIGAPGKLSATGGRNGFGGDISVSAITGNTIIAGLLDTSAGNDGGYVAIDADDNVTTTSTAVVNAKAGEGGSADSIDITAFRGGVSLAGTISAAAAGSLALGGGSAGDISVDALGPITIDATMDVTGGGPGAFGGSLDVNSNENILVRGPIDASAAGTGGYAGFVSFVTRTGQVDIQGRVDAIGPASGGDISAFSFNGIAVSNRLTADGPSAHVGLKGCGITITSLARLSSQQLSTADTSGQTLIQASGQLTIAGSVLGSAPGANRFEILDQTKPPAYGPRAIISPSPTVALNPSLFPCGGPTTTTTTSTTSSSTTSSSTTSSSTTSSSTTTSRSTSTTTTTRLTVTTVSSTSTSSTTRSTTTTLPAMTTSTTTSTSSTTSSSTTTSSTTTTSSSATSSTATSTTATSSTATSTTASSTTSTTVAPSTSTTTVTPASRTTTTAAPVTSTTLPPPGCGASATLPCDDGATCDPAAGFDAVDCRLGLLDGALVHTAAFELGGRGSQKRLRSKITGARSLVAKARVSAGRPSVKDIKRAAGKLNGLVRTIRKAERHRKIAPPVGGPLVDLALKTMAQLGRLQPAAPY